MTLSRYSLDKSNYYRNYYQMYRDKILNNYYEKTKKKVDNDKLYLNYGGEANYYKQSLIDLGILVINKQG